MLLKAHSTAPADAAALRESLARNALTVVGLCAAWCDTCTAFRPGFDDLAASSPDSTFVWLDIEDDADLAGDIDVDNFPTIAVFHAGRLLHFGVSLPQSALVGRLLATLTGESPTVTATPEVTALAARLQRAVSQAHRGGSIASSDSPSSAATN